MTQESSNVARHLSSRARYHPEDIAIWAHQEGKAFYKKYTFKEFNHHVDALCYSLAKRGVKPGQKALVMVRPGVELMLTVFALFRMGVVPVVIDPGMGLINFLKCVRRSKPNVLFGITQALWFRKFFPVCFCSVKQNIKVSADAIDEYVREGEISCATKHFPVYAASVQDLAAIVFTSGSTGAPKGVHYTHGNFEAQLVSIRNAFDIKPGEIDYPMLPIFSLFNPALGLTTVVPEIDPSRPASADPERIVHGIKEYKVTNSFGSPVLWLKVTDYCEAHNITLPLVRRILLAGVAVPAGLLKRMKKIFPNAALHTPYGATEVLPITAIESKTILEGTCLKTLQGYGTCVGCSVEGVQVKIIRPCLFPIPALTSDLELPIGEVGEIIVQGPMVTRGYENNPEADALGKIEDASSVHGFWHRMGDSGYLDHQGRLWFCGRKAERIEVAPQQYLYTECVEAIINALPFVQRSALIGLGEAPFQVPALVIQLKREYAAKNRTQQEALVRQLKIVCAEYDHMKIIDRFFFVKTIPVDVRHNAKIHRLKLAKHFTRKIFGLRNYSKQPLWKFLLQAVGDFWASM